MLYDAHAHLQDPKLAPHLPAVARELEQIGLARAVINGTREADWDQVTALAVRFPWIIPSYGLHPWHLKDRSKHWHERLISLLENPRATVGEIGLDRVKEDTGLEEQKAIFIWQLELAAARNLPLTIHCVRAWGALWDILRSEPVPDCGFLIHGYHGPAEMIKGFAKRGAYFSFSGAFLRGPQTARQELLRTVPAERLLVETDAPDMPPPPSHIIYPMPGLNHPANIRAIYDGLAEWYGCPVKTLEAQVEGNFQRLFGQR